MCYFFKTRGYPDPVIHNSKHRAQSGHPQSVRLSSHNKLEGRIPLTLTFHPHNISVKNIILKKFKLLQPDTTTAEIFAYDVGLGLSSPTRKKSPDLSELLPSLIISRAFPPISSTVLPDCTLCKKIYIGETGRRLGSFPRTP